MFSRYYNDFNNSTHNPLRPIPSNQCFAQPWQNIPNYVQRSNEVVIHSKNNPNYANSNFQRPNFQVPPQNILNNRFEQCENYPRYPMNIPQNVQFGSFAGAMLPNQISYRQQVRYINYLRIQATDYVVWMQPPPFPNFQQHLSYQKPPLNFSVVNNPLCLRPPPPISLPPPQFFDSKPPVSPQILPDITQPSLPTSPEFSPFKPTQTRKYFSRWHSSTPLRSKEKSFKRRNKFTLPTTKTGIVKNEQQKPEHWRHLMSKESLDKKAVSSNRTPSTFIQPPVISPRPIANSINKAIESSHQLEDVQKLSSVPIKESFKEVEKTSVEENNQLYLIEEEIYNTDDEEERVKNGNVVELNGSKLATNELTDQQVCKATLTSECEEEQLISVAKTHVSDQVVQLSKHEKIALNFVSQLTQNLNCKESSLFMGPNFFENTSLLSSFPNTDGKLIQSPKASSSDNTDQKEDESNNQRASSSDNTEQKDQNLCVQCRKALIIKNQLCKTCYSRLADRKRRLAQQRREDLFTFECLKAGDGPRKRKQPVYFPSYKNVKRKRETALKAPQAKETVMTHSPQKECSQSVVNNQKEDRSNNKQKEILKPGHCCKCKQFINYIDQSILKNHCADCCDSAGIIICCICKKVKEQSGIAKQTCKWTANFCRWAVLSKQEESTKRSGSGKCFHFKSSQLHGINRFNFK